MKKTYLSVAVGTAVAVGFGVSPTFASHYSEQLFPYVVKDANRTTVVTLIADGYTDSSPIHLQYWTKSTTDANTAACLPNSVFVPFTENDIMTFDTAGLLGYPLFGDTTNPAPLGAAISYAAPRHGYLLAKTSRNDLKAGYWMELDLANGGAHGDSSVRGNGDYTDTGGGLIYGGINLDNWNEGVYGITGQNSLEPWRSRAVNFWPSSVASTAFTVTPLGSSMLTKENNQVVIQIHNGNGVQGAYDRNENGVDGAVPVTVRCVGRVTPNQLMPGIVTNAAWAAQGGWGFLRNLGNGDATNDYSTPPFIQGVTCSGGVCTVVMVDVSGVSTNAPNIFGNDRPAIIYQVDSSTASGKFMTNATRLVNNDGHDWYLYD